jgi:hypothetical protein
MTFFVCNMHADDRTRGFPSLRVPIRHTIVGFTTHVCPLLAIGRQDKVWISLYIF